MSKEEYRKKFENENREAEYYVAFNSEVQKALHKKAVDNTKLYSEKVDRTKYTKKPAYDSPKPFTVPEDDKYHSFHWELFLSDCAYYYDNPTAK